MRCPLCWLCFLFFAEALLAGRPDRVQAAELIGGAPVIAVVEIRGAKAPQMNDASADLRIFKQRATARTARVIKGDLPETFTIENEADSVLSDGFHLAFLRRAADARYVLSSPVSLRRIKEGKAYWLGNEYVEIDEIVSQILAEGR